MSIKHARPNITIFTDASVYAGKKAAGWAGWAVGDNRYPVIRSGPLPFNSNVAICELNALARMIEILRHDGFIKVQDRAIILQSDSTTALNWLLTGLSKGYAAKTKIPGSTKLKRMRYVHVHAMDAISIIEDNLRHFDVIYLRHIKAHQGHKYNEICDRKAKEAALRR